MAPHQVETTKTGEGTYVPLSYASTSSLQIVKPEFIHHAVPLGVLVVTQGMILKPIHSLQVTTDGSASEPGNRSAALRKVLATTTIVSA